MTENEIMDAMFAELDKEILPRLLDTDVTHKTIAARYGISEKSAELRAASMVERGLWRMIPKRARTGQETHTYEVTHESI